MGNDEKQVNILHFESGAHAVIDEYTVDIELPTDNTSGKTHETIIIKYEREDGFTAIEPMFISDNSFASYITVNYYLVNRHKKMLPLFRRKRLTNWALEAINTAYEKYIHEGIK